MSAFVRATSLEALASESFDVLVIGGGMTGTGVAVDAASRGLSVALIERDDFASGTSSKSSKMVHGGLRYLQQHEFRLVYENLHERQRLLDNAPHLVAPLPFLIPLFGKDGVVSKTVARSYKTALWLYDVTGGVRIGKRHKEISRQEVVSHLPSLDVSHLVAGFLYYDARGDDARVALTLARTAADHGAVVVNYAKATEFLHDATGRVTGARVVPNAPGDSAAPIEVSARVVVNAAGVWADEVSWLEEGVKDQTITPAKGVHISVPADRLPCDVAAVIPVVKDKRSVFVVPWEESQYVFIGTTDTAYEGGLDDPTCDPEDVAYLLDAINTLTTSNLTVDDVTGVWAGLRPLIKPSKGTKVSARTADLSRRQGCDERGINPAAQTKTNRGKSALGDVVAQPEHQRLIELGRGIFRHNPGHGRAAGKWINHPATLNKPWQFHPDVTGGIGHQRVSIEHELVIAAHRVAINHWHFCRAGHPA